jgi:cell fate (sporulation/competence/biofilm development) regulator YmcA (YheA/YmcA/DUF963 family)
MSERELTPKEKAEQEDKKLLLEASGKLQEIIGLLLDGNTRSTARDKVKEARDRMKLKRKGGDEMVFHLHQGKRAAMTQSNSECLALGDALELMIQTTQYNSDLQKALERVSKQRVEILERQLGRMRSQ